MMPERSRREEAAQWLIHTMKDLKAARVLIAVEPSRSVFHSQHAAEKAAKGFLTFHAVPFRKTHDLAELGRQCVELNPELTAILKEAVSLTDYAFVCRYPDAPGEPDEHEAAEALEIARRVYDEIKTLLQL